MRVNILFHLYIHRNTVCTFWTVRSDLSCTHELTLPFFHALSCFFFLIHTYIYIHAHIFVSINCFRWRSIIVYIYKIVLIIYCIMYAQDNDGNYDRWKNEQVVKYKLWHVVASILYIRVVSLICTVIMHLYKIQVFVFLFFLLLKQHWHTRKNARSPRGISLSERFCKNFLFL